MRTKYGNFKAISHSDNLGLLRFNLLSYLQWLPCFLSPREDAPSSTGISGYRGVLEISQKVMAKHDGNIEGTLGSIKGLHNIIISFDLRSI